MGPGQRICADKFLKQCKAIKHRTRSCGKENMFGQPAWGPWVYFRLMFKWSRSCHIVISDIDKAKTQSLASTDGSCLIKDVTGKVLSKTTQDEPPCRTARTQQQPFCVIFTARCTLVQSAVLRLHVVCLSICLSVRPSVTLVNCDHIGWNSSKIISPLVSLGRSLFATPT